MPLSLTAAEIDEIAARATEPVDYPLVQPFAEAARADGLSAIRRSELELVRDVLTLPAHLRPSEVAHPYGTVGGMYSHERFTPEQAADLGALAATIKSPEVRAAFADIAWLRSRGNPDLARLAVRSYIESARSVQDGQNWPPVIERAERAIRLARSLGDEEVTFKEAGEYLAELVHTYRGEDPLFLTARATDLLLEFRIGAPSDYYGYAQGAAGRALADHQFHVARAYYDALLRIARASRDEDAANSALRETAESYVVEAKARKAQGNHMAAAHFLNLAIQAYRRGPNSDTYITPLRYELQKAEQASLAQFKPIRIPPIDVSDEIARARKHVSGHPLQEAIMRFTYMIRIANVEEVRRQAKEAAEQSIARRIAAMTHVDHAGRTVGVEGPERDDGPSFGAMIEEVSLSRNFNVQVYIVPALDQILLEHNVTLDEMALLARYSPFVPEERELSFARGLYAAFSMDFLTATNILIPQIENSIRYLMEQRGVITTKLDRQGIQRLKDLGDLLMDRQLEDFLSGDIIFELRALLIDNRGANLRHKVAHGMVNDRQFMSAECIYAFWLVLNLCLFGPTVRPTIKEPGPERSPSTSDNGEHQHPG